MDSQQVGIAVRALRLEDAPQLARMDREITGRNRTAWYEGKLRRALQDSDLNISLGAEMDGHLVGAVLGSLHYGEFGQPDPVAILDTILVDPGHARRGVGRALLSQLAGNLHALGIERLRTEVAWDEHELSRFLGHEGFAPAPRLVLELRLTAETSERISRPEMTGIMEEGPGSPRSSGADMERRGLR